MSENVNRGPFQASDTPEATTLLPKPSTGLLAPTRWLYALVLDRGRGVYRVYLEPNLFPRKVRAKRKKKVLDQL